MDNSEKIPYAKPDQNDPIEPFADAKPDAANAEDQVTPGPASEGSMVGDRTESKEPVGDVSFLEGPVTDEEFDRWLGELIGPIDPSRETDEDQTSQST